ncbi:hypothetical protein VKT23_010698 [Stygiomarasmius scandens]|uniref:DUF6534 domain-containing protein n=1 Tax=Marasmiellus scandens TaxID=2682957 RepID=A0ABR1JBZ9_9AGAR
MEYLMILIIVFSVELFLASRVWLLQRCHWTVPVLIVLCALGSVSAGISTIVGLLKNNVDTLNILQMNKQRIEIVCTCALSSFADVIATVALLWSLSSSRAGIQRTNTLLRKLCQYFVTRGLFVSLYQIVLLIIFLAFPQKLWWMLLFFTISQVYIITMLAILNSRDNLRGNSSTGVINGSEMQFESDFSNNSFPNAGRGQTYGMASLHASRKSDHNVDFVPFQSSASVTQGEGGSDSYNLAH